MTIKLSTTRKWLPWTAAPYLDVRIIGTVSRGPCLAITLEGQYLQVNRAVTHPLNAWQAREAIRISGGRLGAVERTETPKAPRGPVAIVRKKRRALLPDGATA